MSFAQRSIRGCDAVRGDVSEYMLHKGLVSSLFAPASTNMANVAHFMCERHQTNMALPLEVPMTIASKLQMVVPFGSKNAPGIAGQLPFLVSAWNC
jgi:hypothetical protein